MIHLTASGAQNIGPTQSGLPVRGLRVQVNAALTGTITIIDGIGTQAVITNPGVLNVWIGYGLLSPVTINPSTTTDISVSILNGHE